MRRTKIVATLGPASDSREMIERLILQGANVFRLNFSHGDRARHQRVIERVRAVAGRLDKPVGILQDIAGPKIRVGEMEGIMLLREGDQLAIYPDHARGGPLDVVIPHPEILARLAVGDRIYFADGTIQAEVSGRRPPALLARVLVGGKLSSRKGVHFPGGRLAIAAITEKDRQDILFGVAQDVEFVALSFVRSAEDILEAKRIIAEQGGDIPVLAKIERAAALDNLDEIIEVADGVMVARGDLGVELGVHRVPVVQKTIMEKARRLGRPVITATQMLSSMLTSPYPTRAEVSDIANAVLDGTDAVMLSEETAIGDYAEEAIGVLDRTIRETEKVYRFHPDLEKDAGYQQAIAASAVDLACQIKAAGVVSFTYSGTSALAVARHRPGVRILAATSNPAAFRRLSLVWGVEPFFVEYSHANSDKAISLFVKKARAAGCIGEEEVYVVTIGHHSNRSGTTNQIQILDAASFERLQKVLRGIMV